MAVSPDEKPTREEPRYVILEGVVGSTAYNLATPTSDTDYLGVFVEPTINFLGLDGVPQRRQSWKQPGDVDRTLHEVAKYCAKVLDGNPTFMELLWLHPSTYTRVSSWGWDLVGMRHLFLSARPIRDSYLGYATQQFRKLFERGDGSFSSDTRKRTAKHARHMYRLLIQGFEVWSTGNLVVALTDMAASHVRAFGERVADGEHDLAKKLLGEYEARFDSTPTTLPNEPDRERIDQWLKRLRKDYLAY